MTVGLPGTGIGGLFYILLCGFMPLFHAFRAWRGDHKPHHLRTGILAILLSVGILLVLYGEAMGLIWLASKIDFASTPLFNIGLLANDSILAAISPAFVALPFIILFILLIAIQILRVIVHGFKRKPQTIKK